jgi:hypothetical protein
MYFSHLLEGWRRSRRGVVLKNTSEKYNINSKNTKKED